jgi:sugar lactone lactonase YvrE
MQSKAAAGVIFSLALLAAGCAALEGADDGRPWRVLSDTKVDGFTFPESVGCDAAGKVLYVSNFGGTELKPAEKDGKGFISKVALDGKVLEQRAFDVTLNKPKGIWIEGGRLWVTDIDSVWIFDTASRKSRRLELPGIQFANDPAVQGGVLYVSDNRSDQLFRVEPADFLDAKVQPKVSVAWSKKSINPNGVWPSRNGSLLMAGFMSADQARGIHAMAKDGTVTAVTQPIGRLDGLYEMRDGSILATDWNSGSLFHWSAKGGKQDLAKDFKGPADFCVMGDTVYVPDLPQSQVRIIRLGK